MIVQKYGGSSLADAEGIKRVAQRIVATHKAGHGVVVVVSAMGDSTDELHDLALQVSPLPPGRELDMLLTAGERISMALVAMAIANLGFEARSFTGSQAGVITDSTHGKARIIDVTPGRITAALADGAIPIVAGFQGVSQNTKDITTLGRGGSDTTAVALAAALNAAGYAVYANDHRGHGPNAAAADLGHFADEGGWAKVVGDLWTLNRLIAKEQPGTPVVFLGHSLGSFLGRSFIAEHSDALAGAALSGSSGKPPAIATLGRLIARAERLRLGKRGKSQLIFQMWFGDFNKPFKPARTPFEWLSRDEKEVDVYVADPLCGFPFTTQLAIDVLDALPSVTSPESRRPFACSAAACFSMRWRFSGRSSSSVESSRSS